uniref:NADH dehydrogenase subunit 6 n=1 Tax=Brachycladium goliath TaxID=1751714 RepID=A0A140B0Z1_9TREM|nr:NADH dehydrogenase subunit 6 [Brachycladium goliath]ALN38353.1 NADH dehydrogenase subunit 6 [Brachycladium goliath]
MAVFFLSVYFSSLIAFSFASHPVVYCVLLMMSALSVSGYVYAVLGFSWYLVLFCLVYVGGVYVLFIFVSVHSPNPSSSSVGSLGGFGFVFLVLYLVLGVGDLALPCFVDGSHYLCSFFEGFSYCLFCLVLLLGFVCVSVVVSEKDSFFR